MKKLLTGLTLAALAAAAHADLKDDFDRFLEGSYGGAALGIASHVTRGCQNDETECQDLRTTPWKFWGGWRVSDTLGTEISYMHFGTLRSRTVVGSTLPIEEATLRAQSIGLSFAPTFSINQVTTALLRVGVASVKTEYDAPAGNSRGWRGEPLLGAALQWNIGRALPESFGFLRGFSAEIGWDTTRVRLPDGRKWINLYTIGGGLEF